MAEPGSSTADRDDTVVPIRVRVVPDDDPTPQRSRKARPEEVDPVIGPEQGPAARGHVAVPRLSRHEIVLADGHRVGVAVSGKGVPLVVVNGFTAEGFLYAQSLSRLVAMGFKVIAIDTAGHGGTQGLPTGGGNFAAYAELLGRAIDELGIKRSILAGHSMGGRLVTQLAATDPDRTVAVLLLDAIVGDTWDAMVNMFRVAPLTLLPIGITLAVDSVTTVPLLRDSEQAAKFMHLYTPTLLGHVRRPWRLVGPAVSIIRSRGSRWMLQRLAQEHVPVFVIHGDRDLAVPLKTAQDAARQAHGELIVVKGGTHSWVLRDPEVLPAIVNELLQGQLGVAYREAVADYGLDQDVATIDDIEAAFYEPGAKVLELTPPLEFVTTTTVRRRPWYRWSRRSYA